MRWEYPFETEDGRADFHALRHSFISNLVRAGVSPKVAQQLARHSTIALTMDRYAHTAMGDLSAGVESLPPVPGNGKPKESEDDDRDRRAAR